MYGQNFNIISFLIGIILGFFLSDLDIDYIDYYDNNDNEEDKDDFSKQKEEKDKTKKNS